MKRITSFLLAMIFICSGSIISASAVSGIPDEMLPVDLVYESGEYATGLTAAQKQLYYIRSLTFNAYGTDGIRVSIPGSAPLSQCESVTFNGNGPIYIYSKCFRKALVKELYIPENVRVYWDARWIGKEVVDEEEEDDIAGVFAELPALEKVTLDNSQYIKLEFSNCQKLKDVILTNKVHKLGVAIFYGCAALTSISIPESVTVIEERAFCGTGLHSVYIPSQVTTIEPFAFGYRDDDGWSTLSTKVDGFTIYGHAGTEAERYAVENGFTFIDVDAAKDEPIVYDVADIVTAPVGEYATMNVTVGGTAAKIQFVNSHNSTFTYTRTDDHVLGITANDDGSETWSVKLKVYRNDTYRIRLRYGSTWTDAMSPFDLNARKEQAAVRSAAVVQTGAVGTMGQIYVTVDGSPIKVQFKNSKGSTYTFNRDTAAVQSITPNGDGTEIWTINLKVYRKTETYQTYAKYTSGWTEDFVTFTLAAK